MLVTRLLQREEDTCIETQREAKAPTTDNELNTSLHYAAEKGWTFIARKLMEHHSIATDINQKGLTTL